MTDKINDNYKNSQFVIKNLVDYIDSCKEININKENCVNYLYESTNYNINEEELNNIFDFTFGKKETINKQDALNKLSSLFQDEENKKQKKSKISKSNNNNNVKGLVFPKNKISIPTISIPIHNINNKKEYKNEILFDNKNIIRTQNKKPLAADRIMINKLNTPSNNNKIVDKINSFKNEFFAFKIPPSNNSPTPLPINIKPLVYENENKSYNNDYENNNKKKYREEFAIKDYNLNDVKQRKEYINDIKGKLKNFVNDRNERDYNFKDDINIFNNINEMIEKLKSKKKSKN